MILVFLAVLLWCESGVCLFAVTISVRHDISEEWELSQKVIYPFLIDYIQSIDNLI